MTTKNVAKKSEPVRGPGRPIGDFWYAVNPAYVFGEIGPIKRPYKNGSKDTMRMWYIARKITENGSPMSRAALLSVLNSDQFPEGEICSIQTKHRIIKEALAKGVIFTVNKPQSVSGDVPNGN